MCDTGLLPSAVWREVSARRVGHEPDRRVPVGVPLRRGDPTTRLALGSAPASSGGRRSHPPARQRFASRWNTGDRIADAEAWGAGREWMLERVTPMIGEHDPGYRVRRRPSGGAARPTQPSQRPLRCQPHAVPRAGADDPRPADHRQARRSSQWHRLCRTLGEPAPGPRRRAAAAAVARCRSPDSPHGGSIRSVSRPSVPRRCERSQSTPRSCGDGRSSPVAELAAKLALLPGIGQWTIGSVLASAMGDPDAVAVGDFHLKNLVSYRPRRRAAWHRRTHARAARAVRRPARQGGSAVAARRPPAAGVRSAPAHLADGTVVNECLC